MVRIRPMTAGLFFAACLLAAVFCPWGGIKAGEVSPEGVGPMGASGDSASLGRKCALIPLAPIPHHLITATAGYGGTISPRGNVQVAAGGGLTFAIVPNFGYSVFLVTVDGVSVGQVESYTFSNITANRTIKATFIKKRKSDLTFE
ncbi:MAG TPA: hypothetical protein VLS90_19385 [Thermodesulfobacteriota bacterium]|nr:hypothetical protein [Thermodesulfobacteriota bacterium]